MVFNDDEPFRCHYEVLGVGPDADASAIKKAHRKLALRWHPDKVRSRDDDPDEAAREFRYVQRAYECLSDDAERRWYDDHRDALLRGWTASGGGDAAAADLSARLFDLVVPFRRAGAWTTTTDADADDGFFGAYGKVFASVLRAEREVDLDADLPAFGSSDADYGTVVSVFYAAWESFSTAHAFAWEDEYDTTNDHADQCRRVRRLMEEDNKKRRRARRREYNDEVRGLVGFVKRRDTRVIRHRERVEREKQRRQAEEAASRKERRSDARRARELWREEQRREMEETERRDLEAGRFRLADDDDDDDDDDEESRKGRRKGGRQKQKQKRKKRGKKNRGRNDWDTDTNDDDADTNKNADVDSNEEPTNNEDDDVENAVDEDGEPSTPTPPTRDETIPDHNDDDDDESESETDDEPPDVWRCDVCRKDFKSEGQMNNHLRSKKCREAHKKHQKRLEQEERRRQKQQKEEEEAAAVNDLMEGLEVT